MTNQTQKVNGEQLPLPDVSAARAEAWMYAGLPSSDRYRRVRMVVSPAQAKLWLTNANIGNRPISEFFVTQYACDMIDGRWEYNGEPIRFGADGILYDGQHRLNACVESGVPFEVDIVYGLRSESRGTVDIGRVRTAAHSVHFKGVTNATSACALAHMLLVHRKHGIHRLNNRECCPTKTQVAQVVLNEPRICEVAGKLSCGRKLAPPRVMSFCYFVFSQQDQPKADDFFSGLTTGAELATNSPVYLLRARLIANGIAKAKLPILEVMALFFKAWKAYRDGKSMRGLRWCNTGPTPEPFPEI